MKDILRSLLTWLRVFGFNPMRTASTCSGLLRFWRQKREYERLQQSGSEMAPFPVTCLRPNLGGAGGEGGTASGHYFHQDLLVARRIYDDAPRRHVDIGSRVDGFVAHVASFREIEVFDIRPQTATVPGIRFRQADLMNLPDDLVGCTDSLTCLHALEHFGLGRYGDPLDPDGHRKGLATLAAILKPGGTLYLSVPMGPERTEFNAHRVFSLTGLLELVAPSFAVAGFSYVDDAGDIHERVDLTEEGMATSFGCHFGLAILELKRNAP